MHYYWLIGARNLVVESDAKYLKGMLENPGLGPNATINRWIDKILMYHFELHHVAGKTFGADGLSRREGQPGDEEFQHPTEVDDEINGPPSYVKVNEEDPDPLEFEEFKDEIDNRGGYVQSTFLAQPEEPREAKSVSCFQQELNLARKEMLAEQNMVDSSI